MTDVADVLSGAYVTPDVTGYRRVSVTLVIHMTALVPQECDEEAARFKVEEHTCLTNFVAELYRAQEKDPRHCNLCAHASAHLGTKEVL